MTPESLKTIGTVRLTACENGKVKLNVPLDVGFHSMRRPAGVLLLPPGWDAQSIHRSLLPDQNMRFSVPYFRPDTKIDTLFQTYKLSTRV